MIFPKNFIWGTAAASYQIEGAATEDGKGLSVWDMMARQPGKIRNGETGNIACDHYHRYKEDVQIMSEIGVHAYRLSVSWPRVLPEGIGKINEAGLDFYDRLIDELLEKGISPWITLFHWDFPYSLYCKGGWLNRDVADWFAAYTAVVVDRLSDRVSHWITLNEPQCFIGIGHVLGNHAPGLQLGLEESLLVVHNALLAHGKGVQSIRANAKTPALVGYAPVGAVSVPNTSSEADIAAAKKHMFETSKGNPFLNAWYSDPVILGEYPEQGMEVFKKEMPTIGTNDLKTINQPLDFLGSNIYVGQLVQDNDGTIETVSMSHLPLTAHDWPVIPDALYWGPKRFYERYKLPIVITENGMANIDQIHEDGKVHDPQRINFFEPIY